MTKIKLFRLTATRRIAILLAVAVASAVPAFAVMEYHNGDAPVSGSEISEDTVIDELYLASDMSYTVLSTATLTIKNVTGGEHKFTVGGYGTCVFEHIDNVDMSLDVVATAHVKFRQAARPAACAGAVFHVDASDEESMTFQPLNGTNFVTRWNDVRGGGYPYADKNPNVNCKGHPFAVNKYLNRRPVMDFGTIWQAGEGGQKGVGASQVWSQSCARPMEVFAVIGDTEDSSLNNDGSGSTAHRNNSWYGCTTTTTGYRGDGANDVACEILNKSALIKTAAAAVFTVDGAGVDPLAFRPSSGMHIVSWYASNAAYAAGTGTAAPIDSFASERNYELGGIRIAEYIVFDTILSPSDRADIISYLTQKWNNAATNDFAFASITLKATETSSAEMVLSGGAKVAVGTFTNNGRVTGNGAIAATSESRSQLLLSSDATIDVPVGCVCTIDEIADTGYRLTKVGAGRLVVNEVNAAKTKIKVEGGALEFRSASSVGELEVAAWSTVYVPEGLTVHARVLRGGTPNVVGGTLAADIQIDGGSLVAFASASYDPLAAADAWFHVDASASDSLVAEVRDGTNFVSKWIDVRGAGVYAEKKADRPDPYIAAGALNDLSVMDFGTTWNDAKTDGYGAAMKWSETLKRTMEIFVVEQHNDDMRSIISSAAASGATGPTRRSQMLLGLNGVEYITALPLLLTGDPETGHDSVRVIGSNALAYSGIYAGRLAVDLDDKGLARDSAYYPGYDFHLYNVYMTGSTYLSDPTKSAPLNAFACERSNIFGGQRIAECVVFDKVLSPEERALYGGMLYAKWFDGTGGAACYENATVPAGVTLEMPYQALTLSGSLVIGGCVKAASVVPSALTVTASGALVDGILDLGSSGGVITLPGNSWDSLAEGEYLLVGATAVSGSKEGWKIELPDCRRKAAAPVVRGDGLYANIVSKGLVLIMM